MESVRRAHEADVAELARLADMAREELTVERGGPMWRLLHGRGDPLESTIAADLAEAATGGGVVLVGEVAEVPSGYAVAHREVLTDGTSIATVTDVYVEPGMRDIGLGAALMEALIEWARAEGCRGIDAHVLPGMRHSKNYFERFGLTARAILVHRSLEDAP